MGRERLWNHERKNTEVGVVPTAKLKSNPENLEQADTNPNIDTF